MRFHGRVTIENGVAAADPVATPENVLPRLRVELPKRPELSSSRLTKRILLTLDAPMLESVTVDLWARLVPDSANLYMRVAEDVALSGRTLTEVSGPVPPGTQLYVQRTADTLTQPRDVYVTTCSRPRQVAPLGPWTPLRIAPGSQAFWGKEQVVLSGSDVTQWVDKLPFGIGNAVLGPHNAPLWNAVDPNFGTSITFDDSNAEAFELGIPSDGIFMQQESLLGAAFRPTKDIDASQSLVSNDLPNSNRSSYSLRIDTTNDRGNFQIANSSGTFVVFSLFDAPNLTHNTNHRLVIALDSSGFTIWRQGVIVASGALVGTTNANLPIDALQIGTRGLAPGGNYYAGDLGEIVLGRDSADAADLVAYLEAEHGP